MVTAAWAERFAWREVEVLPLESTRGVGEFGVVDALPDALVVGFAAVTQLADVWFLFALLAVVYWFGDARLAEDPRRAGAVAIALVTCALAAVTLGKAAFAAPRPPSTPVVPVWLPGLLGDRVATETASDGFGFPSGHATSATVAYGGLALLLDRISDIRRRIAGAVAVVVAVAASRVVLRVHYLVDVVAGAALGVVVLAVGLWLAGDERLRSGGHGRRLNPMPVFLLAALLGAVAVAVAASAGHGSELIAGGIAVGTGVGGAVGWRGIRGAESAVPGRVAVPMLGITGAAWVTVFAVEPPLPTAALLTTLTVAAVIATPRLADPAERLWES